MPAFNFFLFSFSFSAYSTVTILHFNFQVQFIYRINPQFIIQKQIFGIYFKICRNSEKKSLYLFYKYSMRYSMHRPRGSTATPAQVFPMTSRRSKTMFRKIGLKLIIAISIATIIIISIFSYLNIRYESEIFINTIKSQSYRCSETIKSSALFEMVQNERPHIYEIVRKISEQRGICNIRIINNSGDIVYASNPLDEGKALDKSSGSCISCHQSESPTTQLTTDNNFHIFRQHPDSSRKMSIINPMYNQASCYEASCHIHSPETNVLGILEITVSLEEIDSKINQAKMHLLLYALITIIALSAVIWFFVRRWVDEPINQLLEATNHVASGDLNYQIKNPKDDQFGILGNSFNNMIQQINDARKQVFQSDKMASLGRLAAGVAHEINNPLTGILTYSSFLLKRTKDQPELLEDLQVIVRETKRSREIVKGLLDFSRQTMPKKYKEDINTIINRAVKVVENQLKLDKITVAQNIKSNLPQPTIDANQIQQVFINLIDNAGHALEESGGTITISTNLVHLPPFGIIAVKNAICPKGHTLMDHDHKFDGFSSVKLAVKLNGKSDFINLDPVYGKNRNIYGAINGDNQAVKISCTHCNISLLRESKKCPECQAPLFFFNTPGRGQFEGCTRIGCNYQYWDGVELDGEIEYIEIKISDTGTGMPTEVQASIFEPFYSTKGQRGTGLGLAVVWGIIDKHDGIISVNSALGKGTTFKIYLPTE